MKRTTPNQANWREQIDFFPYTWREECEIQASHWVRIHNLTPRHGACYSNIIGSPSPVQEEKPSQPDDDDMVKLARAANLMFGEGSAYQRARIERDNKALEERKLRAEGREDQYNSIRAKMSAAEHKKRREEERLKFEKEEREYKDLKKRELDQRRQARIEKRNAMTPAELKELEYKRVKAKEAHHAKKKKLKEDKDKFDRLAWDRYLRRKDGRIAWLVKKQREHTRRCASASESAYASV